MEDEVVIVALEESNILGAVLDYRYSETLVFIGRCMENIIFQVTKVCMKIPPLYPIFQSLEPQLLSSYDGNEPRSLGQ